MTRLPRQRHARDSGWRFPVTAGGGPDDPRPVAARVRWTAQSGLTESAIARVLRAEEG